MFLFFFRNMLLNFVVQLRHDVSAFSSIVRNGELPITKMVGGGEKIKSTDALLLMGQKDVNMNK